MTNERLTFETELGISIDKNEDCPTMSICWNCDIPPRKCNYFKDAIEKLAKYEAIGTIEEFKALKEKSEDIPIIHGKAELELHDKEIYAKGYNQGTIDRAEEVTKAREHGYAKGIDEFAERWKKELQGEHWTQFCTMRRMIDEIAEEMRGAE